MITLDIDGKSRDESTVRMLISYLGLKHVYPKREIEVHLTRRGYHILAYGDDGDLKQERTLRQIFGDDPFRIDIDKHKQEIGSYNFNVLWTIKKGFKVKVIDPLSLDVVDLDQFFSLGE